MFSVYKSNEINFGNIGPGLIYQIQNGHYVVCSKSIDVAELPLVAMTPF